MQYMIKVKPMFFLFIFLTLLATVYIICTLTPNTVCKSTISIMWRSNWQHKQNFVYVPRAPTNNLLPGNKCNISVITTQRQGVSFSALVTMLPGGGYEWWHYTSDITYSGTEYVSAVGHLCPFLLEWQSDWRGIVARVLLASAVVTAG